MAKGGGGSTTVQDVPREFKPAYYRLFNSALGASQQAAQNPFAQGYPNPWANYPGAFGGGGPVAFPQAFQGAQGMQAAQPQAQQQGGGQIPTVYTPPGPTTGQIRGVGGTQPYQPQLTGLPPGWTGPSSYLPYSGGPPIIGQPFPGPFTAPTTDIELQSLQGRENVGRQLQGIASPLLGLGTQQAQGAFLNPYTNPYFQGNIEASLQPAIDAFTRSVAPQFGSQAVQSGAYKGSSARDFAFGNLANDFGRNLAQTAAQAGMQNYLQERMIQQQTPQLLQQAAGIQQISPEILAQVGAGQRELMQRPLDELLLQFQEAQQAPFRPLGPLASIIQGTNIGVTERLQGARPSPVASGIAGALGGAGLGLTAADQLGLGSLGTAGLGGLGGLLGGLGGGLF